VHAISEVFLGTEFHAIFESMELSVAKGLIENGVDLSLPNQTWADLGAGDGLFTKALAGLLPRQSKIISLDKDERALKNISIDTLDIELQILVADLNHIPPGLSQLDGLVMANALHYIKSQTPFLVSLKTNLLKKSGVLLLVEYNLDRPNAWVPFPISKNRLLSLSKESGFELEIFPNSVKSRLNSSEIYSALLKPKM
jgi:trans-aconitate methyltransferase